MFVSFPMFSHHLSIIFPQKNMDFPDFRYVSPRKTRFDPQSFAEAPAFARAGLLEVPKTCRFRSKDGGFWIMNGIA